MTIWTPRKTFQQYGDRWYPNNLWEQDEAAIRQAFEGMLSSYPDARIIDVGPLDEDMQQRFADVAHHNQQAAEDVARKPEMYWRGRKVIIWRGCYCIREIRRKNKRYLWVGKAVTTETHASVLTAYDYDHLLGKAQEPFNFAAYIRRR